MFNFLHLKPKRVKRDLGDVESILQSSLKPVSPRPEFIQNLHKDLLDYSFPQLETTDYDIKKPFLFALVGFISLLFIFSLWVRLVLVVLSTIGMIQSSRRKQALPKISES
jgi:hypothetical protein